MHNNSSFEVPRISSENPQIQKCSQAAGTFGRGLGENVSTSNIQKKRKRSSEEKDSEPIADVGKGGFKRERSSKRAQVLFYSFYSYLVIIFMFPFMVEV